MANNIPFVAHARIVPNRGNGKRFEIHRSRQKIAATIYEELLENFTDGNIAQPGGGQTDSLALNNIGSSDLSSFSNTTNGVAVKPQFGEQPDLVTIVGFYDGLVGTGGVDIVPVPYGEKKIIHANECITGPASGAPGWNNDTNPSSSHRSIVSNLKSALESSVTSLTLNIVSMEVQGVKWGWGGHHF